jgi:hypothetical protein
MDMYLQRMIHERLPKIIMQRVAAEQNIWAGPRKSWREGTEVAMNKTYVVSKVMVEIGIP